MVTIANYTKRGEREKDSSEPVLDDWKLYNYKETSQTFQMY